jgi:hypothetical protein
LNLLDISRFAPGLIDMLKLTGALRERGSEG